MNVLPTALTVTTDAPGLPLLTAFETVDVDNDLFVPADMMVVDGPADAEGVPLPWPLLRKINRVAATVDVLPAFAGSRLAIEKNVGDNGSTLRLEAASAAKVLVDCAAPQGFAAPAGNLATFATMLCGQLGVAVAPEGTAAAIPRTDAVDANSTEPVWSILDNLARQVGAWMWCDGAGLVHIEELAPYYAVPPVDELVFVPGSPLNNIISYKLRDEIEGRYSHIYVKGHGSSRVQSGPTPWLSFPVLGLFVDPELAALGVIRPLVIDDPRARSIAQAQNRAYREYAIRKIGGNKLEMVVPGWTTSELIPWQPTQMVTVTIPADGIAGPYFVAGRRFLRSLQGGTRTELTLVEPGVM